MVKKGNLANFIVKNEININQVISWAKEISAGMAHLHAEGIIHRDLAVRNLLLTETLEIKISDFGLARVTQKSEDGNSIVQKTESNVGPLKWMAPESLTQREYSTKSDVWA